MPPPSSQKRYSSGFDSISFRSRVVNYFRSYKPAASSVVFRRRLHRFQKSCSLVCFFRSALHRISEDVCTTLPMPAGGTFCGTLICLVYSTKVLESVPFLWHTMCQSVGTLLEVRVRMDILLYQFGPAVVALFIAIGASFIHRRSHVVLTNPVRQWTSVGMAISLGFIIIFTAWSVFPWWMPPLSDDSFIFLQLARYITPLVLCVVALVFLIVPAPIPGPSGTAALAPRTLLTFASRAWLGVAASLIVGVVALSALAGMASSADESGRHVVYEVQTSSTSSASTTIYGWWFSIPCLILIAALAAIALLGLIVISRPALAVDSQTDSATRAARVRNILSVSTGGLLLHLSVVLQSLYATSSLRVGMTAGPAGWVDIGTSFAAIGPVLQIVALIAFVLGMAMWWSTLLSVLPSRNRQTRKSVLA